jgi:hypothetical protein
VSIEAVDEAGAQQADPWDMLILKVGAYRAWVGVWLR